jgi:hypothetical protein
MVRAHLVPALFSLLLAAAAQAQIVNVQSRFADAPEPGFHGALEGAVDWRTGSQDYLTVRGGLTLQGSVGDHLVLLLAQGEHGVAGGERTLARTLEHLRYRYRLTALVSAEAFIQHELNLFRRLQLRALVGAGPRLHLLDHSVFGAVMGLALMAEHERLRTDEHPDAGARVTDLRLSSYLLGRFRLMENVSLVETVYFQPRLDAFRDLRILNETALVLRANPRVSVTLAFLLSLDRAPPAGVSRLDTQLRTSLGVGF